MIQPFVARLDDMLDPEKLTAFTKIVNDFEAQALELELISQPNILVGQNTLAVVFVLGKIDNLTRSVKPVTPEEWEKKKRRAAGGL